jgi:hypothetical protein
MLRGHCQHKGDRLSCGERGLQGARKKAGQVGVLCAIHKWQMPSEPQNLEPTYGGFTVRQKVLTQPLSTCVNTVILLTSLNLGFLISRMGIRSLTGHCEASTQQCVKCLPWCLVLSIELSLLLLLPVPLPQGLFLDSMKLLVYRTKERSNSGRTESIAPFCVPLSVCVLQ